MASKCAVCLWAAGWVGQPSGAMHRWSPALAPRRTNISPPAAGQLNSLPNCRQATVPRVALMRHDPVCKYTIRFAFAMSDLYACKNGDGAVHLAEKSFSALSSGPDLRACFCSRPSELSLWWKVTKPQPTSESIFATVVLKHEKDQSGEGLRRGAAGNWNCFMHLTHFPLDKMAAITQTIFSDTFWWMKKKFILIKISLKFVPKGQ